MATTNLYAQGPKVAAVHTAQRLCLHLQVDEARWVEGHVCFTEQDKAVVECLLQGCLEQQLGGLSKAVVHAVRLDEGFDDLCL